jgi:hypothetical protein
MIIEVEVVQSVRFGPTLPAPKVDDVLLSSRVAQRGNERFTQTHTPTTVVFRCNNLEVVRESAHKSSVIQCVSPLSHLVCIGLSREEAGSKIRFIRTGSERDL